VLLAQCCAGVRLGAKSPRGHYESATLTAELQAHSKLTSLFYIHLRRLAGSFEYSRWYTAYHSVECALPDAPLLTDSIGSQSSSRFQNVLVIRKFFRR
jgi:hypothetical protein